MADLSTSSDPGPGPFEVLTADGQVIKVSSYEDALVWCCQRYGAIVLVADRKPTRVLLTLVFLSDLEGPDMTITDQRQTAAVIRPADRVRYISIPTPAEREEVKEWIRKNHANYEDAFDCSADCCHDLGIFDRAEYEIDPRQDRAIAHFVGDLTSSYYDGQWE